MKHRLLFLCLHWFALSAFAAERRPNVLFLVVDDLNCRIGCYGDPIAQTPHIDRLAQRGVRFERAYCNYPVCNPSRSSVLSGRYPTTTGVLDNRTWLMLEDGHPTLPRLFEKQGYASALFGKVWHIPQNNGYVDLANLPDNPVLKTFYTPAQRAEQRATRPDFWQQPQNYDHYTADPPHAGEVARLIATSNVFGPVPVGNQTPDITFARNGIAQMQQWQGGGKPFFLAIGFHKPHVPLQAPQEYFDQFVADEFPLPPDFANTPSGPPGTPADSYRQNLDLYAGRSFTSAEARAALRAYYACVSYTDSQIGRVLAALDASGQADNTIVILWGDHGWHLSDKGMWAKGTLFEAAVRAPLIIVDPRLKGTAGKSSRRIVQFVDIYPTLAELCGLPLPAGLDGVSLKTLLNRPDAAWAQPAFTVQTRGWFIGRSIRTERWRYTEWDEGRRGMALFDHESDPHELVNLAPNPAHRGTVAQLRQELRESKVGRAMVGK